MSLKILVFFHYYKIIDLSIIYSIIYSLLLLIYLLLCQKIKDEKHKFKFIVHERNFLQHSFQFTYQFEQKMKIKWLFNNSDFSIKYIDRKKLSWELIY